MAAARTNIVAALRALEERPPGPLCVIHGPEAGLRQEALEAALRGAARGADAGAEPPQTVTFGPPDPARPASLPSLAAVLDEVRTDSLFAPRKTVAVRGAGKLLAGKSAPAALLGYLRAARPGTLLVLEVEKFDARTALAKKLAAAGALVHCPRLYETPWRESAVSIGDYLKYLAGRRGLSLEPRAAARLLELAGGETAVLAAELGKLADYLGGRGRPATVADVEAVAVGGVPVADDVVLPTLGGRAAAALRAAGRAFDRGLQDRGGKIAWNERTAALLLVSALWRAARRVEAAMLAGGRPQGRMPPKLARALEAAAARWSAPAMEDAYRSALAAEMELKSSSGRAPREVVEELILGLSGARAAAVAAGRREVRA